DGSVPAALVHRVLTLLVGLGFALTLAVFAFRLALLLLAFAILTLGLAFLLLAFAFLRIHGHGAAQRPHGTDIQRPRSDRPRPQRTRTNRARPHQPAHEPALRSRSNRPLIRDAPCQGGACRRERHHQRHHLLLDHRCSSGRG